MTDDRDTLAFTCFDGVHRLVSGDIAAVAIAARRALDAGATGPVLTFDDATGRSIDLDLRGSEAQIAKRYAAIEPAASSSLPAHADADDKEAAPQPRGRGRPKLGVVAREVTLLPRHWEWLAAQPGGASVVLRKLVDAARRANADVDQKRRSQERTYHFMSAMAGDYAGFEEASRALFAGDWEGIRVLIESWPEDVKAHVIFLGTTETRSQ